MSASRTGYSLVYVLQPERLIVSGDTADLCPLRLKEGFGQDPSNHKFVSMIG